MISLLLLLAALQSTDFGLREVGTAPSARAPEATSVRGSSFSCAVASITDGDTLRCADGTRVRIAGIDAPEISACA